MGADPGIPDKNGLSLIDWIRNCRYLVRMEPTPFFTLEYVTRIIQMMEQSSAVHSLSQLIAEYADMQNTFAINSIWSASSR